MLTPTRSAGSRSGVNWTRFHEQSIDAASAFARLVLPTPGTSSMSRWPSASRQITASSIGSILPSTTWAMLDVMASNSDANRTFDPSDDWSSPPAVRLEATVTRARVDGAGQDLPRYRCAEPRPRMRATERQRGSGHHGLRGRGTQLCSLWCLRTWRSTSATTGSLPVSSTRRVRWSSATESPHRRATCGRRCTASCAGSSRPVPTTPIRSRCAASVARGRSIATEARCRRCTCPCGRTSSCASASATSPVCRPCSARRRRPACSPSGGPGPRSTSTT